MSDAGGGGGVPDSSASWRGRRSRVAVAVGVAMMGIGAFVALHPLWSPGRPVTTSLWLDMVFALFFLVRGAMNVRAGRRARSRVAP